jgi:hypothetical protein
LTFPKVFLYHLHTSSSGSAIHGVFSEDSDEIDCDKNRYIAVTDRLSTWAPRESLSCQIHYGELFYVIIVSNELSMDEITACDSANEPSFRSLLLPF